ncbi:MAG: hypothetical protein ACE5H3_02770 [Planctomycetota bacterium]
MLAPFLRQAADPFHPDLIVLGIVAQLLAALFLGSSAGKGRPRHLLLETLGGTPRSLSFLRDRVHAKVRGQAGAVLFSLGSLLLLGGFLFPGPSDWRIQAGGSVLILALSLIFLSSADRYVERSLRRYLREYLREHPFPFHEHIALTREIGAVFGVEGSEEDTFDAYLHRLRAAIGIAPGPGRPRVRPVP